MRVLLAAVVLFLTACAHGGPSLESDYRTSEELLASERYDEALTKSNNALTRAEGTGKPKEIWRFRLLKAEILIGQRQAANALLLLNGYGEPPLGNEWEETRARLLLLRGRASYTLNRLKESEDLLARASLSAKQLGSDQLSAEVLLRQGVLWVREKRFDDARQAFKRVDETAVRRDDTYQQATAVGNMGFDLLTESRFEEAIPWLDQAITLFTAIDAKESVARAHGNLGNCYFRLGDYDSARAHYDQARSWFSKTGNRDGQQIWTGNAGNVSFELADYMAAEAAYRQALEIARKVPSPVWVARWLGNLALTSIELGSWDEAEAYNNEALASLRSLHDTGYEPTAIVNAARIAEGRGHLNEARELFRSALAKRSEDPATPLDAHAGLARVSIRENRPREAETEFQNTVALIEQQGAALVKDDYKLTYLDSLIRFYRQYVQFLIDSHQPERALEVAESSRSHVLAEKSGGGEQVARHTAADYRRLAREMNATLLEYWLSPRQSYLWVISPERIDLHMLADERQIQPWVDSYRAVVVGGRNPLASAVDAGQKLSQTLIAPASAGGATRFLVVPDGALSSFPLESLPAPGASTHFWVEEATVELAPSLNYLASARQRAIQTPMQLLAIGDPVSSNPQYPRLEFAAREVDSIASNMVPTRSAIRRGESATPDSYSAARPGEFEFIHFAAHATANPQSPLDSAVILSGPSDKDRLLARDVAAMPLSARLVTISACRSAGERAYAGEGLVGFAWAFLRAGARNVIAGLWDVSDQSTARLMATLYRRIAAGDQPMDALRAAKLDLIHAGGAYSKPFYWAPFQTYAGSPR